MGAASLSVIISHLLCSHCQTQLEMVFGIYIEGDHMMKLFIVLLGVSALTAFAGEIDYTYGGRDRCHNPWVKHSKVARALEGYLTDNGCENVKADNHITYLTGYVADYEIDVVASCGNNISKIAILQIECRTFSFQDIHFTFSVYNKARDRQSVTLNIGSPYDWN